MRNTDLTTLVNGQVTQQTSAQDRGLLYGQTVFETIAVGNETPLLLDQHLERLQRGCDVLGIPFEKEMRTSIVSEARQLCENQAKAVLRITLSMGEGGRGYRNPQHAQPSRVLSLHSYPELDKHHWNEGIELGLVSIRLSSQPLLAGIKHGNRLEQIIARSQWQDGWHEALILDQSDRVIEGTQSNVFVYKNGRLSTPNLDLSGVAGVMRQTVIELAEKLGIATEIVSLSVSDIEAADEVFMTNSVIGLWPVKCFQSIGFDEPKFAHKLLKLLIENEVIPNI